MTANAVSQYAPKKTPKALVLLTLGVGLFLLVLLFGAILFLSPVAKPAVVEGLVREVLKRDPAVWPYTSLVYAAIVAVLGLMLLTFGAVVSDGTAKAHRVRVRTGSFTAMSIIEELAPGLMIADLVALISSLDVVAPEIDR